MPPVVAPATPDAVKSRAKFAPWIESTRVEPAWSTRPRFAPLTLTTAPFCSNVKRSAVRALSSTLRVAGVVSSTRVTSIRTNAPPTGAAGIVNGAPATVNVRGVAVVLSCKASVPVRTTSGRSGPRNVPPTAAPARPFGVNVKAKFAPCRERIRVEPAWRTMPRFSPLTATFAPSFSSTSRSAVTMLPKTPRWACVISTRR